MNVPITLANGSTVELNNITESGNGYIRFSDGTQICYHSLMADINEKTIGPGKCFSTNVTYPKPFIDYPVITPSHQINSKTTNIEYSTHKVYVEGCASTEREAKIEFTNDSDESINASSVYVSYIAIGRWK